MKRLILAVAAMFLPMAAHAQTVTIAGTATPSVRSTNPGLVLTSTSGSFNLDLDLDAATATPDFRVVNNLFTLGTAERIVLPFEDTTSYPVSVLFSFTNPVGTADDTVTGQSFGFYQLFSSCGVLAGGCGRVVWDGPQTFNFGQGGSFSIALNDVTFGTPGVSQVGATFRLITSSVPEASSWAMMIAGFGAVGFAMRRRNKVEAKLRLA